ncbi:MAG: hypothetical protein PHN98_05680 [Smithellaceae bacterium]|nr:hypothetical protein [Smithellaceae bacterium]
MEQVYKIQKDFIIPFLTAVVLLFVLLVLSLFSDESWEKILLACFFIITMMIGIEALEREVAVSENGLRIRKFFRTKKFTWAEITHLGVVIVHNKAYFLLTTTRGFYILSNLLEDHTTLIRFLAGKLGDEKVEVEVKNYLEHSVRRTSLIVLTWVVVLIIAAIILTGLLKL